MIQSIPAAALKDLSAPQRAQLIYHQARAELSDRLWRAALGDNRVGNAPDRFHEPQAGGSGLDALIALLVQQEREAPAPQPQMTPAILEREAMPAAPALPTPLDEDGSDGSGASSGITPASLGPNARHLPALTSAASRAGIPAPVLAAIINAEAAKGADGAWNLFSRNPRSSAAGLGQFLSGTWVDMAEAPGTWLNQVARDKGWLDARGNIVSQARASLLSLRYDATASINTIADYARRNLDGLKRAGVNIGNNAERIAHSAYLGHHLGLGDAVRFMKEGLSPSRARMLLGAQIGTARASAQIAAVGDATAAHRAWFLNYVGRTVRVSRYQV